MLRTVGCAALVGASLAFSPPASAQVSPPPSRSSPPPLGIERALIDAIARAEKSVVAIARVRRPLPGEEPAGGGGDFRRLIEPDNPDYVPNDFATGVVIDAGGQIVTNQHVLGDVQESEYYVTTAERRVYRARVVAADPRVDLAVLEIDAQDLVPIRLGDASGLQKGQIVVALGNPYAIARDGQASASWGIVANLGRKAPAASSAADPRSPSASDKPTIHHHGTLIQTDARLNFGTSGGALLNLQGELVGLTTSIAALAGYETAAGYAIPVDDLFRRAVEALRRGEEVDYGFLGVAPRALPQSARLAGRYGVEVDRTIPGTPAQGAFQPTDVITHVDGRAIHDADGLMLELGRRPAESEVRLTVLRQGRGRPQDIALKLAKARVPGQRVVTARPSAWRGLRVDFATAVLADGELPAEPAVAICAVEPDSPAERLRLRVGQAIVRVGGRPVRSPSEFRAATAETAGAVSLQLADGQTIELPAN
jgi:serine protease Do